MTGAPRRRARGLSLPALGSITTLAVESMRSQKARTALTVSGVVVGVAALVVMGAALEALDTSVRETFREVGAGVFRVQREERFGAPAAGSEASSRAELDDAQLELLARQLTTAASVSGEMWSWGHRLQRGNKDRPGVTVIGGGAATLESNALKLSQGRALTPLDERSFHAVVILGADLVAQLFPGGELEALGAEVELGGHPLRVIGTLAPALKLVGETKGSMMVIPRSTFVRLLGSRSMFLSVRARQIDRLGETVDEARQILRKARRVPPQAPDDFVVTTAADQDQPIRVLALAIGAFAGTLALLALFIGGVGVTNVMLAAVSQRTREIGVRMALGARPEAIWMQFVLEASLLTCGGGLIGVVIAWLTCQVAGLALELPLDLPGWALATGLSSSILTGVLAGTYPAVRAARMDPIEALRYE